MAPSTVRMVLVEGEDGDGVTVEQDDFDVAGTSTQTAPEQVISAILGTREGAAGSGYDLRSTGVTWTDQAEAAQLRDALAAHKMENVMLVSAFLAAAALAQEVGNAVGYNRTGLVFVEPDTATMAIVDSSDGSITELRREPLRGGDIAGELAALVRDAQTSASRPDGLYLVGSGVDIAPLKPQLEATTPLPVMVPEEPDMALARGAALASAHAPLFSSATEALAYARDPGTGAIDRYAVTPGYSPAFDAPANGDGDALAYSALADDDADAYTAIGDRQDLGTGAFPYAGEQDRGKRRRMPVPLLVSGVVALFVVGAVALVVALIATMNPTTGEKPNPGQHQVAPSNQAPPQQAKPPAPPPASAPAPAPAAPAPAPEASAPAPAPAAPAPEPAPAAPAPAPAPAAPAPAPAAPAPAPAPVAPAPPPAAPAPVPVPIPIPVGPPGQGPFNPGQGPFNPGRGGGGGIPGLPGGGGGGHGSGGNGGGHGGGHGGGGGGGIPGIPNIPGIPGL